MAGSLASALAWWPIVLVFTPLACAIGATVLWGFVLPQLIPRDEIERLADDILRRYPDDPEEAAFIEEQASWFRSQMYEQARWRRVRKRIRRCSR